MTFQLVHKFQAKIPYDFINFNQVFIEVVDNFRHTGLLRKHNCAGAKKWFNETAVEFWYSGEDFGKQRTFSSSPFKERPDGCIAHEVILCPRSDIEFEMSDEVECNFDTLGTMKIGGNVSELSEKFGAEIKISNVVVGRNLNVAVIRGFAPLDVLAYVSAPDVYNQLTNQLGTQRDPNQKHATDVLAYALSAVDLAPEDNPRAFPEIILNARDVNVVALSSISSGELLDFNSSDWAESGALVADLKISSENINESQDSSPQISRVDGNHRLLNVRKQVSTDPDTVFPDVPFALFIGLSPDQERSLFRDINGEQKPMDTAHLDTIKLKLHGDESLVSTDEGQALWIAKKLSEAGMPFEEMVFFGGEKGVFKKAGKKMPPIKINTLKGAVSQTLRDSNQISQLAVSEDPIANAKTKLDLVSRFWIGVKDAFPDGWQDRTNYVLLQAIGLTGFAKLGAVVIDELVNAAAVSQQDFNKILKHVASKVDLSRGKWAGMAGLAGAKQVFNALNAARGDGYNISQVLDQLNGNPTSALDD